jgi:hypothetical protein
MKKIIYRYLVSIIYITCITTSNFLVAEEIIPNEQTVPSEPQDITTETPITTEVIPIAIDTNSWTLENPWEDSPMIENLPNQWEQWNTVEDIPLETWSVSWEYIPFSWNVIEFSSIPDTEIIDDSLSAWSMKESLSDSLALESNAETVYITDSSDLLQYLSKDIIPKPAYNKVDMVQDFVFSSHDAMIQAFIAKHTTIRTRDDTEIAFWKFSITQGSKQLIKKVEVIDSAGNVIVKDQELEWFSFGVDGQHLLFSKPVQITMATLLEDGSAVDISVKHEWDINFNEQWLTTDPNATCDENWETNLPSNKVLVQDNKITFYTCGASIFSVSYSWGPNFANFADASIAPGYIDKSVNFAVGSSFPAGSIIKDVNLTLDFRPIDRENPTGCASSSNCNGSCFPNEKYFRLTSPSWTQANIITNGTYNATTNPWALSTPASNCPRVNLIFDDEASNGLWGNYNRPALSSWKPASLLSIFDNQSPFGNWTLRMWDTGNLDGVILFGFTVTIDVYNAPLCIFSPNQTVIPNFQVKNVDQERSYQFDDFQVQDPIGSNSGYYTTLQMSNLNGPNSQIIPNTQIQWKADPVTLITGTANSSVVLWSTMWTYHLATATDTFIKRDTAPNSNRTWTYGSKLWLKVNIPAYTRPGSYTGSITYTLYEN